MHFDPGPLLSHVVHDPADKRAGVIDRQRGALTDLAQVVEVIRPLLAILELEREYSFAAVLPFSLLGDTQTLGGLLENARIGGRWLVRLGRNDRNGGKSA